MLGKYKQAYVSSNHELLHCQCTSVLDRDLFANFILEADPYNNVEPCTSKECILVHMIIFRRENSFVHKNIRLDTDLKSNYQSKRKHVDSREPVSTDVTGDIIASLSISWDEMAKII